jgi:transcriptional regulator with XRE-family HTH domain
MKLTQTYIANKAGVSQQLVSAIIRGKARPSWKTAKLLARATDTTPELWLDGSSDQIKAAVAGKKRSTRCLESASAELESSCFAQ